jgi:UDP-N-acetylglucosamine 2-epimerase (non-hydrolysing)
MHRPSNVDQGHALRDRLETIRDLAEVVPVLFAVHPRTQKSIAQHGYQALLKHSGLHTTGALSYEQTVGVMSCARLVLTDSGGLQEETTALGVPCLTLREATERPVTVHEGTNVVVGTDRARILSTAKNALQAGLAPRRVPALWDGRAAERIAAHVGAWFASRPGSFS